MKYSLHIAFDEFTGDTLLRSDEYIRKFRPSLYQGFTPLVFLRKGEGFNVGYPEVYSKPLDFIVNAIEITQFLPLSLLKQPTRVFLNDNTEITDYFEEQYIKNITQESQFDPELHIVFYVNLFEDDDIENVCRIISCFPKGYRFKVSIITISICIGKAIGSKIEESINNPRIKEIRNIRKLTRVEKEFDVPFNIFTFENRNMDGWSMDFSLDKFVSTVSTLSTYIIAAFDEILCRNIEQKEIYAFNTLTWNLDVYHFINSWIASLFNDAAQDYFVEDIDDSAMAKINSTYSEILAKERSSIKDALTKLDLTQELSDKDIHEWFDREVKKNIEDIINGYIKDLNTSEKVALYSKFTYIDYGCDLENVSLDGSDTEQDQLIIDGLLPDDDLEVYLRQEYQKLKNTISEIQKAKSKIQSDEDTLHALESQINNNLPDNVIVDGDVFRVGNDIFKPSKQKELPLAVNYEAPTEINLLSSVDLRKHFSAIKNQGQQGACTAFSLVSIFEYFLNKSLNSSVDLSEAFLYYNARKIDGRCNEDEGSTFQKIVNAATEVGLCIEQLCPYNERDYTTEPSEEAYSDGEKRKVTEAKNLITSIHDVKSALNEGYPVVISLKVFDAFNKNVNGFVDLPTDEDKFAADSYHAMVVCGYSDKDAYFIVRNSWGTQFGDQGYCYLPYELFRMNGYIDAAYVVTGINLTDLDKSLIDIDETSDDLLKEWNVDSKYVILKNTIHEKHRSLDKQRSELKKLQKQYVDLCKKLQLSGSNENTALKEIEERIEALKEKQEEKSTLLKIFKKKDYALAQLNIKKNSILINSELLTEIPKINSRLLTNASEIEENGNFLDNIAEDVNTDLKKEQSSFFRKVSPYIDILKHLKNNNIFSRIEPIISKLKSTMSDAARIVGLDKVWFDLIKQISKDASSIDALQGLNLNSYVNDKSFISFRDSISRSSVMSVVGGHLPIGYGCEAMFIMLPDDFKDNCLKLEPSVRQFRLTNPDDRFSMSFLHLESYNVEDIVMFQEQCS